MVRENFDRKLRHIRDEVLLLESMVENAIRESVVSLKARDLETARQLIAADKEINTKRLDIENETLVLIATQQPAARDLRFLASVIDLASELERMGDYAKGIAKINLMMKEEPFIKPLIDIPAMARKATDMLHRATEAFISGDVETAYAIPLEDDEVDALYNQVYRELLTLIMENPRHITQATYLLWAAHNLERTADRVTNICERVIYMVTGRLIELDDQQRKDEEATG